MFNFVASKRVVVTIILVIVGIPFAFFGIDYYFRGVGTGTQIARVAGGDISPQEFNQALRQYQDRLRQMMGGKVDQSMLDSPEVRRSVLNQLVDERLLYSAAQQSRIAISNAELQGVISNVPEFKDDNGKFSPARYREALSGQGMSEGFFEASVRKNMMLGRTREAYAATAFMPATVVERLYRLSKQQREVSQHVLEPGQFTSRVKVTPEEAKAYYDNHKQQFELPEKVKLQYVILSAEGVQKQVTVTPQELQEAFKARADQLARPEERRASHILVSVPPTATPEQKAKAKEKADALLAEAKSSPKGFAELAKRSSADPGSAREGGDLGFVPRGRMVKPFDDAMFGMKVGDIVGPVETQFGYHIIKLDAIKAAEGPKFDAIKDKLAEELRKSKAGTLFAQQAEEFTNLVYDQPDSLQPAADKLKLQPQTSGWITRRGGDFPLLNNDKLLRAVFSDNAVKRKQNTEAIEIGPNMLVSARVVEHEPAKQRGLEEVQAEVVQILTQQKAVELTKKEGESLLAALRKGEQAAVTWSPPQIVTRERREGLHQEAAQALFSADVTAIPAYVGVDVQDGRFAIYRISKVVDVPQVDPEQQKALAKQLDPMVGQQTLDARVMSLREKGNVKINDKLLAERAGG